MTTATLNATKRGSWRLLGAILGTAAILTAIASWTLLDGPKRGAVLGGACLLAGAVLLGPKLREYAGALLVVVGGLLGGVSLLWLLVVGPAIDSVEQRVHDLTHPTISVPEVDLGGAVQSGKDAVTGLIGGRP
jgi:hypothetical protein